MHRNLVPVKHATETIRHVHSGRAKMLSMRPSMDRGKPSTTAERAGERAVLIARKAHIFAVLAAIFGLIGLLRR
jgi:hypothetical protein